MVSTAQLVCKASQGKGDGTRHYDYSVDSSPTGFHLDYVLIQLYMYSKNCVITVDTAAVK